LQGEKKNIPTVNLLAWMTAIMSCHFLTFRRKGIDFVAVPRTSHIQALSMHVGPF